MNFKQLVQYADEHLEADLKKAVSKERREIARKERMKRKNKHTSYNLVKS